jgi:hypothetical protein
MRRLSLVAILSAVLGSLPVTGASSRTRTVQSLGSAIASGRVRAVIVGTGASSGDSVMLVVAKTNTAPAGILVLTVSPGTMLHSAARGYQNMMVAGLRGRCLGGGRYSPSSRIKVAGSRSVTYILSAYCTDPQKKNATSSVRFAVAKTDHVLGCIAARGRGLSIPVMQTAVWRHTSGLGLEDANRRLGVNEFEVGQCAVVRRYLWRRAVRRYFPPVLIGAAPDIGGARRGGRPTRGARHTR